MNIGKKADLVFASSSRLFTAFLGYKIARKSKATLYLDIRDIFVDSMNDILKPSIIKSIIISILELVEKKTFKYANHINLISLGFKEYFEKYKNVKFSFFSNGVGDQFLKKNNPTLQIKKTNKKKSIVYAGNIGEGQGLEKIIPQAAKLLGNNYTFFIFGDGGSKNKLKNVIDSLQIKNVILNTPVSRNDLNDIYINADYLFLHLNDYPALRKVLPSKIFELATFSKPIIAGVSGYSANFINEEISHSYVFKPCDVISLVNYLSSDENLKIIERNNFIKKYNCNKINNKFASNILRYL